MKVRAVRRRTSTVGDNSARSNPEDEEEEEEEEAEAEEEKEENKAEENE